MTPIKSLSQRIMAYIYPTNDNKKVISLFEVKSLYDDAYEEKAKARMCLKTFKTKLAKAEALDRAYRAQEKLVEPVKLYGKAA